MSSRDGAPFSYAEVRPYAVAASLDELQGPDHGVLELPHELAWSGRRRFDLDDDYDRGAAYKIVLEEGREEHFRRFVNGALLRQHWGEIRPARQVRALWEQRFPELRDRIAQIHNTSRTPKPGRVAVWDNLPQRQRETDAVTRLIVSRLSAFSGCGVAAEGLDGVRQASA